jgi:putative methylase
MKKRELEILLQGLEPLIEPKPQLEQYPTPANIAADILFTSMAMGDIQGRSVCDLGCGNGIFAIGAKVLGASVAIGVDVDPRAVDLARINAETRNLDVSFILSDVRDFKGPCDTVIQNPPFGSQRRGADRPFLERALKCAKSIYTLHMEETEPFLERIILSLGGRIEYRKSYKFNIPHMFGFHSKEKKSVDIMLLLIRR